MTLAELNVLGNRAPLATPLSVEPILWIAWVYLGLRYLQAFNESSRTKLAKALNDRMHLDMGQYVITNLDDAPLPAQLPEGATKENRFQVSLNVIVLEGWKSVVARVRHTFSVPLNVGFEHRQGESVWRLPAGMVICYRVKNLAALSFTTSIMTELYLPFAIGALPLFVAMWKQLVKAIA